MKSVLIEIMDDSAEIIAQFDLFQDDSEAFKYGNQTFLGIQKSFQAEDFSPDLAGSPIKGYLVRLYSKNTRKFYILSLKKHNSITIFELIKLGDYPQSLNTKNIVSCKIGKRQQVLEFLKDNQLSRLEFTANIF